MHLRRAVLLLGVILLVTAIVGALVPVPRDRTRDESPRALPPAPNAPAPARTLSLRFPASEQAPRVRIAAGSHVVLQVATSEPGQATVAGLDLVAPAEPDTPARFDVLLTRTGSFAVAFQPALGGPPRTVGTLTVAGAE